MDTQNNYYQPPRNNGGKNTGLIVAVAVLSAVLVIGIVFAILVAADVISFGGKEQTPIQQTQVTDAIGTEEQAHKDETPAQTTPAAPQPIPVGATMYTDYCDEKINMYKEPSTSSSELLSSIGAGTEIYVVEYTNDEFAKVSYWGKDGYIERKYLVWEKPNLPRFYGAKKMGD